MPSPFLTPGDQAPLDSLALLHLRRDQTVPTILRAHDDEGLGYNEGKVVNTRFGSFPHSTLYHKPWGSQIVASKQKPKAAVAASSGFLHLLYPTPELWTASLPHRTQVVYTPDYSYILHRLCVRPGSSVIEAGAGSGSFTHAAVRAVFNGYPSEQQQPETQQQQPPKKRKHGKVHSFEFHAQRASKVREEISEHGLDGLVEVTHRDVYEDGFLLNRDTSTSPSTEGASASSSTSPKANAVFLDLPAPWLALRHLTRECRQQETAAAAATSTPQGGIQSALDPTTPVYICTFSPCLEQSERTISAMRQLGWLQIEMVEVNHRRIEVKREKYGLEFEGARGAVVFPRTVDEAVDKTRTIEERTRRFREVMKERDARGDQLPLGGLMREREGEDALKGEAQGEEGEENVPGYKQGRLIHRTEPDLKTHTSWLVFAVLPRDWTEEDEKRCCEKWPAQRVIEEVKPKGKKQLKREERERKESEKQ
ncbi:tRNA methyltransferase complex GCD14 subunit [Aspergillus campestris IBT 28561]|uniref:tRNA (adenine(58)-N(1))-methyltransferase catalytic subunit TRM61 n=1 Tax=Aspergillus campestris (strain IBT 28561) TaxID=1392248 RepID=A0A2I1D8V7_ASPC2|nr:tRNA methyltransferase complex GCD14 subunit [Aspergillus campestris IBT 28561]PKY06311.1 tRNA methyltransferase complex GCD14 subunit [Aspergillus campestris IBT 28561]